VQNICQCTFIWNLWLYDWYISECCCKHQFNQNAIYFNGNVKSFKTIKKCSIDWESTAIKDVKCNACLKTGFRNWTLYHNSPVNAMKIY